MAAAAVALVSVAVADGPFRTLGLVLLAAYLVAVLLAAALAGLHVRSLRVGLLVAPGLVATQAAFVVSFLAGGVSGR
jgi:hypothetical protein